MDTIDKFYDLIDQACMLIYEKVGINYLDSLIRVSHDITYEMDDAKLDDDDIEVLKEIYERIDSLVLNNEEIRQALELLIIKAFKHAFISLDLMTPDYINYLFSYIISKLYSDKSMISIMDVNLGTGNLLNAISNFLPFECNLVGIENNEKLVLLAKAASDLQGNTIRIYYQDCLKPVDEVVDVIVGDLDTTVTDDKYLPYEILTKYTKHIEDDGYFIYLIPNDFFSKPQVTSFRTRFTGTLLGLIVLPEELFKSKNVGKSIIIGTYKQLDNIEMMVLQMPSLNDKKNYEEKLLKIEDYLKIIKEKNL